MNPQAASHVSNFLSGNLGGFKGTQSPARGVAHGVARGVARGAARGVARGLSHVLTRGLLVVPIASSVLRIRNWTLLGLYYLSDIWILSNQVTRSCGGLLVN
jgi:hypothetical protein